MLKRERVKPAKGVLRKEQGSQSPSPQAFCKKNDS